ncbi:hypothetical protein DDQ68_18960 [Hymenobacter nivis]|uniref:Uncharacterized protein n=1 Tax=Hymenobacter nivis TaxID=1850093 RepID=A0A2Z3GZ75_9BACT|nr:hypothetical protein DDQ68_18960 [Hymenobacter nivis]
MIGTSFGHESCQHSPAAEAAQAALASLYKKSSSHTLRQRCQLVLLKATGRTSKEVGDVVGLCQVSVNSWVKRYQEEGIVDLKPSQGADARRCSPSLRTRKPSGRRSKPITSALPLPGWSGKASGRRGPRPCAATRSVLF